VRETPVQWVSDLASQGLQSRRQGTIGKIWVETWNSRDLGRILTLYDDDAEMSSPGIVRLGLGQDGRLRGKNKLRDYWSRALLELPNLHLDLLDVFESPDSAVVRYLNDRGPTVCEYLRLNPEGRIVQASANHLVDSLRQE
jgi:hypothetical protein